MPIVTHGFTLVTPCGLREVREAISDCGFPPGPNPNATLSLAPTPTLNFALALALIIFITITLALAPVALTPTPTPNQVLEAISDFGFTSNSFPITLSLELHLCPEQMAVLRCELIEVFGRPPHYLLWLLLTMATTDHGY